jgi:hypothetical protein
LFDTSKKSSCLYSSKTSGNPPEKSLLLRSRIPDCVEMRIKFCELVQPRPGKSMAMVTYLAN